VFTQPLFLHKNMHVTLKPLKRNVNKQSAGLSSCFWRNLGYQERFQREYSNRNL